MKKILSLVTTLIVASAATANAQYYLEQFNNLNTALPGGDGFVPGGSPTATYSGSGMNYNIYSPDNANIYGITDGSGGTYAMYGALNTLDRLAVKITSGNVLGIGGDFWLANAAGATVPGLLGITVGLSDNTTANYVSPGYWAPAGKTITDLWLTNQSGNPDSYATMDNLWVAVPEPGVIVTNPIVLLGALGGAWAYRRRQS